MSKTSFVPIEGDDLSIQRLKLLREVVRIVAVPMDEYVEPLHEVNCLLAVNFNLWVDGNVEEDLSAAAPISHRLTVTSWEQLENHTWGSGPSTYFKEPYWLAACDCGWYVLTPNETGSEKAIAAYATHLEGRTT